MSITNGLLEYMECSGITRRCPVCGKPVIGRSDKKFCSEECRIFSWNRKYSSERRAKKGNVLILAIGKDLEAIAGSKSRFAGTTIKIIAAITRIFKLLYKFEG